MNYVLTPSLEHIVLAKIVGKLWNQEDIKDLLKKFCTPFDNKELIKEWPRIEERVKDKVLQLPLPGPLKENALGVVKPMGIQISRWLKYYGDNCLKVNLPNEFCWTPQGTVDEKKTAELLIKDESIDITIRYQISCYFCLENDVVKLWNEVPEEWKNTYFNDENDPMTNDDPDFVDIWTYDIKGELSKDKTYYPSKYSLYQCACSLAAREGNKAFLEYFLRKLTSCERKIIVRITDNVSRSPGSYDWYSDIVCTLITHMDKEQQLEIFQSSHSRILVCFLHWPWQSFFAETLSHLWTFFDAHDFFYVLRLIIYKVTQGFKEFNYQKLFAKTWQQSPNALKRSLLNSHYDPSYLLSQLFEIRDIDNIKLILHDATMTQKQKIISCECLQDTCEDLLKSEEWNLLKFFIQDCVSSKDEMTKFKADFQKRIGTLSYKFDFERIIGLKEKWDKFFSLLDDITYESSKRKFMEDDDSNVKKLATEL